jgi:hypothetical protein
MTAQSVLLQAGAAGLQLRPHGDRICIRPLANLTPELKAAMVEHKQALLDLLRAGRVAETRAFYGQAFSRLGALYPDSMIGDLWPAIVSQHPALARGIDVAEQAADAAALAYQQGTSPDSAPFLAALQEWEARWTTAIGAIAASTDTCSDCGAHAVALVGVDYDPTLRYCARCLRPEPLAAKPKTKGCDA